MNSTAEREAGSLTLAGGSYFTGGCLSQGKLAVLRYVVRPDGVT